MPAPEDCEVERAMTDFPRGDLDLRLDGEHRRYGRGYGVERTQKATPRKKREKVTSARGERRLVGAEWSFPLLLSLFLYYYLHRESPASRS